jgi:hypothetical protein
MKRILALPNPYGGRGTGPAKWEQAKKLLDLCHLDITVKHTEYRNHAYEIVNKDISLGQYDGILTIPGDDLIHESINGIMKRPNKEEFLKNWLRLHSSWNCQQAYQIHYDHLPGGVWHPYSCFHLRQGRKVPA